MKTALRWLGAILGVLVFVMLVAVGVGTALPINHTAMCAAQMPAPPHDVWLTLANPLDYAWRSDIVQARLDSTTPSAPAGRPHPGMQWTESDRYGHTVTYQRVSAERDRHLVNRIADPTLPFGGTWTYDLTPAPAVHGTTVSIVENGQIYNPVFRFLAQFFIGYTSTMRTHLADLGKKFGANVAVSCVSPSHTGRP